MRCRWMFVLLAGLLLPLAGCVRQEAAPPLPEDVSGFVFFADPLNEVVTRIELDQVGPTLEPQFLPSNTRILVPDVDLELSYFSYQFVAGNRLRITSRYTNVHERADYHQPFFFTLNAIENAVRGFAPLVTDEDLGGDGILEPGEETASLTFEVIHQGRPFTFYVDANAVTLTTTFLGHLGGGSSWAQDVSDLGQVVGFSWLSFDHGHAFLWEDGVMTDLGTLGGMNSSAHAINNRGQIAGNSATSSGENHAFLWEDGVMTDLGTLGGDYSRARGLNNLGQVVGNSTTATGETRAFLWEDGVMTDLGVLPGQATSDAWAISDRGQIVGGSVSPFGRAFLWEDGVMTDLGFGQAHDINIAGQVVGQTGSYRAVLWEDGEITELGVLGTRTSSVAFGINDLGQVIGWSWTDTEDLPDRMFLWEDGVMTDLGALDGYAHSGYLGGGISNRGQVTGISYNRYPPNYYTPRATIWEIGR